MSLLTEILSSRVRAEFFSLFWGLNKSELHLREIERQAGFSIGAVRHEASKLVRIGLLNKRTNSNRTYYSANTRHRLYPEIHSLVLKTIGLADILTPMLEIPEIKFAFVFGSIAKGTASPESDVDLFVIGDIGLRRLSKLLLETTDRIGREINIHTMSPGEFVMRRSSKEHFVSTVLSAPILMLIGNADELASLA